jgi:pimeloyl-ACP methyl ester carboxylesterase
MKMTTTYRIPSQGFQLSVEEMGQGLPVIFAHGLGGNREITRQQWETVADRCRVICFDQRGHGDSSPVTESHFYNQASMGKDFVNLMDALGIPQAVVGGISMGACTALNCAAAFPERVLMLLQAGPAFNEEVRHEHQELARIGSLLDRLGIEGTIQAIAQQWHELGMPQEAILEMERLYRTYNPQSMALAYHIITEWEIPKGLWNKLKMPVGILAWRDDPIHDFEIARAMFMAIPDAQLKEIPGVFTPNLGEIFYENFLLNIKWRT